MNPLRKLEQIGQSVWLDFISRDLVRGGGLRTLIQYDGVTGVTSNPSIFQKAIAQGKEYDADIKLFADRGADAASIFHHLSVKDVQDAASLLKQVYDSKKGADGFVSIEVSPGLAFDAEASLAEARALWKEIGRENLMVKIPGTKECIPAIRAALADGININITLLFSRKMYEEVVEAWLSGLEQRAETQSIDKIASVASFFVSRIDTKVDAALEEKLKTASIEECADLENLRGKIAIANAKLAYQHYKDIVSSERWKRLAAKGARPQRLLWASTSTKNKAYRDVLYVESLIGANTVNTIPPETLDAFREHGHAAATLDTGIPMASDALARLEKAGISLDKITNALIVDGVEQFRAAADTLFAALEEKRGKLRAAQ
jgi:transaldolase/glucose-6-phosphate isomerase